MIVADASWVIALQDPEDPHHSAAVDLDAGTRRESVLLHPVTFAECLVGAARSGVLDDAAATLRAAFEVVTLDAEAPVRWAQLRATTRLRLPDVVVLDTALVHGATTILTFDAGLAAAARNRSIAAP